MRTCVAALVFASGLVGYAADLAAFGYELYADEATGAYMRLPPGFTAEVEKADENSFPTRLSPAFSWDEGELAGLGVRVFRLVLMPGEGGKAERTMTLFEEKYELTNLVAPAERGLTPERLAAFGPEVRDGRIGRYEYDNVEGTPSASLLYYVDAGVYVYVFAVKWPRANAAAEETAGRMTAGFSVGPPAEAAPGDAPEPPPPAD